MSNIPRSPGLRKRRWRTRRTIIGADVAASSTRSTEANSSTVPGHEDEAHDVAQVHRSDEAPDEFLVLDEEHGAGDSAPSRRAAQQDRRSAGPGNPCGAPAQEAMAEVPEACAAVSGAKTPSMRPVPNDSGSRDMRLATL